MRRSIQLKSRRLAKSKRLAALFAVMLVAPAVGITQEVITVPESFPTPNPPPAPPSAEEIAAEASRHRLRTEAAERFAQFLAEPSPQGYLDFYSYLVAHPLFDLVSVDYERAEQAFLGEQYEDAAKIIEASWPNFLLMPQAHFLLTGAYKRLGSIERAKRHSEIGKLIITSILATGDGTKQKPYLVTRLETEKDVLRELGKETSNRRRVTDGDRSFNVYTLPDESEIWFELTAVLKRLREE